MKLQFDSRRGLGIFLFINASSPILGSTQLPIQWIPGAKRTGRKGDHSPPYSTEVKNAWSYTSTAQYAFMAWYSDKTSTGTILHLPFGGK